MRGDKCQPAKHVQSVIDAVMQTGEWEWAGRQNDGHGLIRHSSGRELGYPLHKSSDPNVPQKILREAEQIMRRQIIHRSGRKRSRRPVVNPLDERRAEAVIQSEINDLLAEMQEIAAAIPVAARTALNSRSMSSHRFLSDLKRQYRTAADRLTELWPEWKESS